MGKMPTFEEIARDFERGVRTAEQRIEHPFRRDELRAANPAIGTRVSETAVTAALAPRTPAQQPVNLAAATAAARPKENRMSLAQDLHNLAGRVEHISDEVITGVEAITAHPETATLIKDLSALIGINPPAGVITAGLAGIRALLTAYAPAQQAAPQQ